MTSIFISYRRDDSSGWSGRLAESMRDAFGVEQVFVDIATLEPGSDYAQAIEQRLASADVLVAVIGPRWLTARGWTIPRTWFAGKWARRCAVASR